MEFLNRSLTQYTADALLFLCVSVVALALWVWFSSNRYNRLFSKMREILRTRKGHDIEDLLYQHLEEQKQFREQISRLSARVQALETQLAQSKRHLGMVRYDAFEDVGGRQSFAVALYDDDGNGVILNGIAGRVDSRLYCKRLVKGRSDLRLSQEEERAIREARESGPKTIVAG